MALRYVLLASAAAVCLSACEPGSTPPPATAIAPAPLPAGTQLPFADEDAVMQIQEVLGDQTAAWNRGDIDGFMEGYWRSPALRFASGGKVSYGWNATRSGYLTRYDTPEKMGRLDFTDISVEPLGTSDALVFGRWTLTRGTDTPTGLFTLHMKRLKTGWKVVSNHTSAAD